jgi:hypothetical protein
VRTEISEAHRPAEVDCRLCRSRGRYLLTDKSRAQALEMSGATWRRRWRDRHELAMDLPRKWERRAISHVKFALRDDA